MAETAEPMSESTGASRAAPGSSALGAAFNLLCVVVGTGMLNLPRGLADSGYIGLPLLALMCAMAAYTAVVLGRLVSDVAHTADATRHRPSPAHAHAASSITLLEPKAAADEPAAPTMPGSYADLGAASFGPGGRWFVNVQQHLTLLLVGTLYHLLSASNLVELTNGSVSMPVAILIVGAVLWPHCLLKTLGEVAPLSYLNMAVNVSLLVVTLSAAARHPSAPPPPKHEIVGSDLFKFGTAFASFGFAYGVHPVLPSILASMRRPRHYARMVGASFFSTLLFYVPIMVVCYDVYGDRVLSPVYRTPELQHDASVRVIIGLITAHLLFAYPVVMNPPERALEGALRVDSRRRPLLWRMVVRSLVVCCSALVSLVMQKPEFFGPFLDLVSSVTSTFTVYILPCVFNLKLRGVRRMSRLELMWNGLIIGFALVGATFGSIQALRELIS